MPDDINVNSAIREGPPKEPSLSRIDEMKISEGLVYSHSHRPDP